MINAYLARFAEQMALTDAEGKPIRPQLDESGFTQLFRGSATIGVNVLERQGVLMIFALIMPVPVTGREAFYRRLLELSFVSTQDAAFAINARHDEIVVRCLRRLSALDFEEFEDLVNTVGEIADRWDDVLVDEFGT